MKRIGTRSINSHIKETIYMDDLFEYIVHSVGSCKYIKVLQLSDRKQVVETKRPLKRTNKALWILKANLPLVIKTYKTDKDKAFEYCSDMLTAVYEVGGAK